MMDLVIKELALPVLYFLKVNYGAFRTQVIDIGEGLQKFHGP